MTEAMVADWRQRAACRGQWDIMFRPGRRVARRDGARIAQAKALCASCAVIAECQADAAEAVDIIGRQIGDVVGGRLSDEWGVDGGVDVAESARKATRGRYLALHATHTLRAETRTQ